MFHVQHLLSYIQVPRKQMGLKMCKCGAPNAPSKKYCAPCHAAYMRAWRSKHPLTAVQRAKDNARSYAGTYLRRGRLVRQPCKCGSLETEMHHKDYSKPLLVEWECRPCHLLGHATETPEQAMTREATARKAARKASRNKAERRRQEEVQPAEPQHQPRLEPVAWKPLG